MEQIGENTTADISPITGIIYVFHLYPWQLIVGIFSCTLQRPLENKNRYTSEKNKVECKEFAD